MLLNCGVEEDLWVSLGLQGAPTSSSWRRSVLNVIWKDWCWRWNSNTLASWWDLTHLKIPWCWERLNAGGEGDDRGWDSWMASPTQWTWVWVNSGSWWYSGRPGVLQFMGSQRVGHKWVAELNWSCMKCSLGISNFLEEISRLSYSIVFLYFFALITEEDFLISQVFFETLSSNGYIFPFLLFPFLVL